MLTGEILSRAAERFPERTAIIAGARRFDYRALDQAANRFAHALIRHGLKPSERVAILCGNRPEYPIAYFGIARAGGVSAHMSPRYLADEIIHALNVVDARLAVVEAPLDAKVADLRDKTPRLADVIAVGDEAAPGHLSFDHMVQGMPEHDPALALDASSPGSITFTGGTTGLPKAALLTHEARSYWARVAVHDFGLGEDDVNMMAAPLYHAAGGFIWFQPTVAAGGTSVLLGHWNVAEYIAEIERTGGTGGFLVPAQIDMLLGDPAFDPEQLRSLKKLIFGAAPAPAALLERAEKALPWVEFIQNFGQTETGPLITQYPADRRRNPEALGRARDLVEAGVYTAPGVAAKPGEVGEIAARGVHLMRAYLAEPDETAAFFRSGDGWGWTGDLATVDGEGQITLVGRVKDVIIAGGVNIYPAEIERVLIEHPLVAECAAFGIPDERWGELPVAAVVATEGAEVDAEEVAAFCAARLARHKRPRRVEVLDELPRSPAGKILRTVLAERYAGA
jgi:acyl-CoA synthetase (AMP-forming)/AMP-acid ligase II